jgi:hypothetical protein
MLTLLLLADGPHEKALGPVTLALARAWRDEAGGEVEIWGTKQVLGSLDREPLEQMKRLPTDAATTPGAQIWLALCQSLAAGALPLLIRSAYPGITLAHLQRARELLELGDAVFGTSADGGYGLVGLARAVPELFAALPWGTSQVMAATRTRAKARRCRIHEFPLEAP